MLEKINNFKAKEWLILIISIILFTDLTILLNIPILREISTFLCFTFIPGMIILQILKLNKIEFIKKFVLWVALSLAFLIFMGLFLNTLYPVIMKPLSLGPILVCFNTILITLAFIAYKRNKKDFKMGHIFNIKIDFDTREKLISPLIFPVLFPILAILGTYVINTEVNNIILVAFLLLIPVYLSVLVILRDRLHEATYPFAAWMIGMSLILMQGLSSYHLMGRDVHLEFHLFQLTLKDFHWNVFAFLHPHNASISVTILPTVYKVLSNISAEYIFKLYFALIGSIIPLFIYIISKKYVGKYAFFASLLFIFQSFFMFSSLGTTKQIIALVFFLSAILILFDYDINKNYKKILFLVFMFSAVLSHYTTAYIGFIFTLPVLLLPFLKGLLGSQKRVKFTNFDIIIPLTLFYGFWYFVVAEIQAKAAVAAITSSLEVIGSGGLVSGPRDSMLLNIFGIGLKSIPNVISTVVHDATFITIGIGLLTVIWKFKYFKDKIGSEYIMGIGISVSLLLLIIVIPFISIHYGAERILIQSLVFLAPVFVIGANSISKIIKKPKSNVLIMLILLVSLFSCNSYLQYHFYGIPHSPFYETNGTVRNEYYIYDQEITAAKWLKDYGFDDLKIYSDKIAGSRLMLGYNPSLPKYNSNLFNMSKKINGYIYLGYVNVNKHIIYLDYDAQRSITDYSRIFKGMSKVYDNGGAEIWK